MNATADPAAFIRANTRLEAPALVPEIALHLAHELVPLWQASEVELERLNVPPPYWAFAWAGGQALSRYLLDNPELVRGKAVLDFGAGSGLQGLAAARAGAARVLALDIDAFACAAIRLNAAANGLSVEVGSEDLIGDPCADFAVILAGDVCYERPMAGRVEFWLKALAAAGKTVLLGDPGRTYLPREGLERITGYAVKTTREIEDTDVRNAVVWRVV
jgi:predicted nicotinamide N-methyase